MYLYYNNKHSRKIVVGQWLIWVHPTFRIAEKRITLAIAPLLSADMTE